MIFLRRLLYGYVLRRLIQGRRHDRGGYPRGYDRYGYGRRPAPRGRGGLFPLPHYSTRTRSGSRVSVGGCCLPIPLGLAMAFLAGARRLRRR